VALTHDEAQPSGTIGRAVLYAIPLSGLLWAGILVAAKHLLASR